MLIPRLLLSRTVLLVVGLAATVAACASSRPTPFDGPSYDLPSISDATPEKARVAYVLLKPEANWISIFNTEYEYDRVEIYRRDADTDSLRRFGTARFPPPPDPQSIAAIFGDSLGASLDSRYEFHPSMGEDALPLLPVTYATSESGYAAEVEGR